MPEQILTILERRARRAQSAAEGVFEIVDANVPEPLRCGFAKMLAHASAARFESRYFQRNSSEVAKWGATTIEFVTRKLDCIADHAGAGNIWSSPGLEAI